MNDRPPAPEAAVPLPDRMARLASSGATGVLAAVADRVRREIMFVNGEIRAARSEAEEEKLGKWLVERKRITEDIRALTLLAQGVEEATPLGGLLVNRGVIDQELLVRELQELTLAIIQRAAAAALDRIEFQEGRAADQPDTLPDLFTSQIILIAARAFGDPAAKRKSIGTFDQTVWPSSELEHMLDDYALSPAEGFMLSRLRGVVSIANLFQLSALPEEQAIATLYPLIASGVIRVGERGARPPKVEGGTLQTTPTAPPVEEAELNDRQRQDRQNVARMAEELTRVDHYRALGLRAGAPADDVSEAWKKVQQRFAPERASEPHLRDLGPRLAAIVERAREAYGVLSSVRDRRRYDAILSEVERDRESLVRTRGRAEPDAAARSAIVEANIKRADELAHDGELYLAIQLLEQACALDPRPGELVKLSRLLLRNPLWTNRALSCMRRAIQIDPEFVEAWLELAKFWRRRKNQERERKALEKALAAAPDDPKVQQAYLELAGKRELDRLLRRNQQNRR